MKWKDSHSALEQTEMCVLGMKSERIDGGDKLKLQRKELTKIISQVKSSKVLNFVLLREDVWKIPSMTASIRKFPVRYKEQYGWF